MKLSKNKILVIVSIFCITQNSFAQFSQQYKENKEKYKKSALVILNRDITLNISLKKGELDVKKDFLEEKLYLDKSANYGSKENIMYSHFYEIKDIEASTFVFDKNRNKYKEIEVEDFKEKDEMTDFFHDDTKSINFIYPNLSSGAKSRLSYTEIIKNPRFLSPFYFGDASPIINNKITVVVDKNIDIEFKKVNFSDENLAYSTKEKRGNIIHTWQLKEKDEYDFEENSPSFKTIIPHIIPIIKSYKSNGEQKPLLNDVSDLYNWYYSMVKDTNKDTPNEELKKTVIALTKDKKTELEKVKAIYYWVQQHIKYIAFEYALGGFIPREANDVFNKKYGDCKDNSSILQVMLEIAGIEGNITWIGTRKIPYKYDEVPTPIVDNHMILSYQDDNGVTYYLDATGRYNDLGTPTSFIQGKEALIGKGEGKYEIKTVPILKPEVNFVRDTTQITIHNNEIKGSTTCRFGGYYKENYFSYLENKNTKDEIHSFYNKQLRKGNNSFLISDIKETNKFTYEKDFIINYNFNIKDYAKTLGNEIYINLNFNKNLSYYKKEDDRKNGVEYKFKPSLYYNTTLTIPNGYIIDYLPENVTYKDDLIAFTIYYKKDGNKLIYNQKLDVNFIVLTKEQQQKLNKVIKKLEKNYKEIVVLKKA